MFAVRSSKFEGCTLKKERNGDDDDDVVKSTVDGGRRTMDDGQWTMDGRRTMKSTTDDGRWAVGGGWCGVVWWAMDGGQMDGGRRMMDCNLRHRTSSCCRSVVVVVVVVVVAVAVAVELRSDLTADVDSTELSTLAWFW